MMRVANHLTLAIEAFSFVLEAPGMSDCTLPAGAGLRWMIPNEEGGTAAEEENVAVAWKTGSLVEQSYRNNTE